MRDERSHDRARASVRAGVLFMLLAAPACASGLPDSTPSGNLDDGRPDAGPALPAPGVDAAPSDPPAKPPGESDGVALPFAVDGHYAPSGYMGDGEVPGAIAHEPVCTAPRPGAARGACHRFTYTPGAQGWAGVFWQHPHGNWGEAPGLAVAPGATRVSFYAWGNAGDEVVTFVVGISDVDGFTRELRDVALTPTPTRYTIDLSDVPYQDVVGAFGWVTSERPGTIAIFIDDVAWE